MIVYEGRHGPQPRPVRGPLRFMPRPVLRPGHASQSALPSTPPPSLHALRYRPHPVSQGHRGFVRALSVLPSASDSSSVPGPLRLLDFQPWSAVAAATAAPPLPHALASQSKTERRAPCAAASTISRRLPDCALRAIRATQFRGVRSDLNTKLTPRNVELNSPRPPRAHLSVPARGAIMDFADRPSFRWLRARRTVMKILAMMGLGLCVFFTGMTLPTSDANAAVCARGYRGAACVGRHGAVGVRRGYYPRGRVVHVHRRRW